MGGKKRILWLLLPIMALLILLFWQVPTFLKAMPSRYVARLPEPVQALGERGDGVPILPTVAAPAEVAVLLADLVSPMPTATKAAVSHPSTLTPIPVDVASSQPEATVTTAPTFTTTPEPIPPAVRLEGFQHIFQTWNNCGPATTAMALSYFGLYLNQADTAVYLKWFNLGTIDNQLGQYERAATAFDQARAIGLPWRMLWYQFGPYEAYYQVGRYKDVLLLTDVTLKDRPYFEESFYYRGLAQEALGDSDNARSSYQKAENFNPNFQPAQDALNKLN